MRTTILLLAIGAGSALLTTEVMCQVPHESKGLKTLRILQDAQAETISVYRRGARGPILVQNAKRSFRPFLHPIVAPDGRGILTQLSPQHHRHQTGLFWGFTRVNGRDFFHHPGEGYWRRVDAKILSGQDGRPRESVQWQTVYELLDEAAQVLLVETQIWTMKATDREYTLDLQWTGNAKTGVTIGKYDYGGLFLRMPWQLGVSAEVFNAARQRNRRAEGQRAPWIDVGMDIQGRTDRAHIAIFDHPKNPGFPLPWRVDDQFGVGPVRARLGDWTITQGEFATVRHRFVVYTGPLKDVELNAKWEKFSGRKRTTSLWSIAQQEGRAAKFLTPKQAAAAMTAPEEFQVNVFAGEPDVTQPMAFCWDNRGRLWVAENRDYETRGRGFSNSGDSRIVILEDTDHDGTADRRTVFLEGIPFPSAIAVGLGGLWLGAPPNLLFVPDRNNDDRADIDDIEIRLTGWGIRDRHETINSFRWGPDGWLYGCQGYATPSRVGKPKGKGRIYRPNEPFPNRIELADQPVQINGGVWRYHPTQDRFEVVAHGFSNPWGIDFDSKGRLLITACVIPHLWYVIPGGIYHRQGGRHYNPYVYSDIRTIADHRHRSAHGGARVYLSDAFPARYRGRIFMANIHEHAVLTDVLKPKDSGLVGHHGDDFLLANNAQWIGFSIEIGPDGAVYVLDWHDADICGKDVLNRETGRVFRVTPKNSLAQNWPGRFADLDQFTDRQLVALLRSPSSWHARRAQLILQHRASTGRLDDTTRRALANMFTHEQNSDLRLRTMWALHVTGGLEAAHLQTSLEDGDPHIRAWAIQLATENGRPDDALLAKFSRMANEDDSPIVRLNLAAAMQRLPLKQRWPIALSLAEHAGDATDHNIPKMIWFAVEPLVPADPDRALALAAACRIPQLTRWISRRLADAGEYERLVRFANQTVDNRADLLRGLRDGLEGRFDVQPPVNWPETARHLKRVGGEVADLASELSRDFGERTAMREMLATLRDEHAGIASRRSAMLQLAGRRDRSVIPLLINALTDLQMRQTAIRAAAAFDDRRIAVAILQRYHKLNDSEKLDAIQTLASRRPYGIELTSALRRGRIPKRDVPPYVARQLRRIVGNSFVDVWGPVDTLPGNVEALFTKYRELLTDSAVAQADPVRGQEIFKRTCYACHRMYGAGGQIGPELTGANRANLEYVLSNVLTPSAVIQDAYRMVLVLTDEGRVYSGVLAEEDDRYLMLRVANEEKPVAIPKSAIESREISSVSMMPEGLLQNLTDREVLDLIAFLRTTEKPEP